MLEALLALYIVGAVATALILAPTMEADRWVSWSTTQQLAKLIYLTAVLSWPVSMYIIGRLARREHD